MADEDSSVDAVRVVRGEKGGDDTSDRVADHDRPLDRHGVEDGDALACPQGAAIGEAMVAVAETVAK